MDRENNRLFQIEVHELETLANVALSNYGSFRDYCFNFSYKFSGGKIYGIICECGAGGWALSYTLAGRQKHCNGTIKINGEVVEKKALAKNSCYVGEGVIEEKRLFGYKNSIIKQIENGIETGRGNCNNVIDVIKVFNIDNEGSRLNRNIQQISNLRWIATIAVGYSYGKMIYCFPWLNSGWMKYIKKQVDGCFEILKNSGAIIIIPTSTVDSVIGFADEVIFLKDTFEGMY